MSATVYLEEPMAGDDELACEEVRIIGQILWATPEAGEREQVVPMSNVVGVEGDDVTQEAREIESPGGRFTELVTDVS